MDEKRARNAQFTYQVNQIATASKEQLLLITYDIGIRSCRLAEAAVAQQNIEETNRHIQKAQDVIRELMFALNIDVGGEVAENLMRLYDFLYYELVDANIHKNSDKIRSVRSMLEELRATWEQAIEKLAREQNPAPVQDAQERPAVAAGGFTIAG
jgi:flagellar protein FliS